MHKYLLSCLIIVNVHSTDFVRKFYNWMHVETDMKAFSKPENASNRLTLKTSVLPCSAAFVLGSISSLVKIPSWAAIASHLLISKKLHNVNGAIVSDMKRDMSDKELAGYVGGYEGPARITHMPASDMADTVAFVLGHTATSYILHKIKNRKNDKKVPFKKDETILLSAIPACMLAHVAYSVITKNSWQ